MIIILKNKGATLVETLLAFSIFISCIVLLISFYVLGHKQNTNIFKQYDHYLLSQEKKEKDLWIQEDYHALMNTVLR